jgi:hypothetical protein
MANVLEVLFFNSFLEVALGFFFVASWRNFAKKEKRCYIKAGDPRHCTYLRNLKQKNPIIQGLLSFNFCD